MEKIRESAIAGTWYPGEPTALEATIRGYLDAVPNEASGVDNLIGLVSPHAGYIYSGATAAHAYKLLRDQPFDRVVVVAPSHRAHFTGASIYSLGGYRTPLGVVPLDREIVDSLLRRKEIFHYAPKAEAGEHSLEIQLPFLQVVLGDFRLTPVLMGEQSWNAAKQLARVLVETIGDKRVLLVASSDLSHFHPRREAARLDAVVMDRVAHFDPLGLCEALKTGQCEACGGGPTSVTMLVAEALGADRAKVLHYADSGDTTGDTSEVVGYMAAALFRSRHNGESRP